MYLKAGIIVACQEMPKRQTEQIADQGGSRFPGAEEARHQWKISSAQILFEYLSLNERLRFKFSKYLPDGYALPIGCNLLPRTVLTSVASRSISCGQFGY